MSDQTGKEKGEFALLRRLKGELGGDWAGLVGPRVLVDDMAPLPVGDGELLWTTDMLMDGVDFESNKHDWRAIGRKAMAVNVSDCAAMAVRPVGALVAVALENRLSLEDAVELHRGLREEGEAFGCPLLGGDTNSWSHPTVISVTVIGRAEPGVQPVRRDGARAGDRVFVTGPLGGSILGRHLRPTPRVDLAVTLARELHPSAMMDISDGLVVDLYRIVEASGCGARLVEAEVARAIHADAERLAGQDGRSAVDHALHDGEDFELIVAVPPAQAEPAAREFGLLPVGMIDEGSVVAWEGVDGVVKTLEKQGWEHFQ